jgi:hypothetical protein
MDINDIEDMVNDGSFPSSKEKVLEELMYLAIQNNSLLRVLLENQSKLNHILDPSKSQDQHRDELLNMFKEADQEKFTVIMNRISGK